MKRVLLTLMAIGLFAGVSQAAVSINLTAAVVYGDAAGTLPLPQDSLVAFVSDPLSDGFGDHTATPLPGDSFILGADDVLLGIGSSGNLQDGAVSNLFSFNDVTGLEGKPFAMLAFNTAFNAGATGGGTATAYSVVPLGNLPNDGSSGVQFMLLTTDIGGNLDSDSMVAPYTTQIPEPASMALLVAGGFLAVRRRKA